MTELDTPLAEILDALQGAMPAPLATCAPDGTPNVAHISIVQYVDGDHVALPRQFLRKTASNLDANPRGQACVTRPSTLGQYLLELEYVRTERDGPTFESMVTHLDALAAQAGTSRQARLRGVDLHRVLQCRPLCGDASSPTPQRLLDVLSPLDDFVGRMAAADDHEAATRAALEGLEELYGIDYAILFAGEGEGLRAVADRGYVSGATASLGPVPGLVEIASARRQVVAVPNVERGLAMVCAVENAITGLVVPLVDGALETGLPGPEAVRSVAAVPLVHRTHPVGVLYLESEAAGRFGPSDERLLRIIGNQIAVTLSTLAPAESTTARADHASPLAVTYYQADDSIFFGEDYVIKGAAGRILWKLMREHSLDGRVYFTNRELRLDERLELPPGNDNLDSRLVSLRRRLAGGDWGITLDRVGRGRLHLRLHRDVSLAEVQTRGPMQREATWRDPASSPADAA